MDKSTKTILVVIGSIVMVCICGTIVLIFTAFSLFNKLSALDISASHVEDLRAVRVGEEIADFVVPPGFGDPYGVYFLDVTLIGFTSEDELSQIILGQFPEETSLDLDEMLRQIDQVPGESNPLFSLVEMIPLEEKTVHIRGHESTLYIRQGISEYGMSYHSAILSFRGRGGPALLMIVIPSEDWDIKLVQSFIESIQ